MFKKPKYIFLQTLKNEEFFREKKPFFIWSGDTEAPKAVKAETWVSLDSVLARKSLV